MYGYIMFGLALLGGVIGGTWLVISFSRIGKVKCIECKQTFSSFKSYVTCPYCGERFAKRRGKTFKVVK
ncbi:hydrogenase maturation nickel metallochaperone HypA [Microaerobacter geothermalis]|uniref:hydrogenase maturation nickel metallochaperone HypA n=1 Tax=Microaerobacter geothermalis TaxID=674972 RepID=UPI001F18C6D9|nr:hydrogenase maturation nickel metallochaperone HypA [Microaerobacter geothermalis]MCF6093016.1 hydrogenase maturation nickel metallochaperone HypA [Microaerobacter geothermalis]